MSPDDLADTMTGLSIAEAGADSRQGGWWEYNGRYWWWEHMHGSWWYWNGATQFWVRTDWIPAPETPEPPRGTRRPREGDVAGGTPCTRARHESEQ